MKRVKLTGKDNPGIKALLESNGFELTDDAPELIIPFGGDGALFSAERKFPGLPKFPIRDIDRVPLCAKHEYGRQIELLAKGDLEKSELIKLKGSFADQEVTGINDILIHNKKRVSAVRYMVWINDTLYAEEIVGDGVCVATVHGSTAYYRSITHSVFNVGIGLAFSNSTQLINHLVLPEDSIIRIKITRGPAILVADNDPREINLNENDEAVIRKTNEKAVVYGLDIFMCSECRKLRHSINVHPQVIRPAPES